MKHFLLISVFGLGLGLTLLLPPQRALAFEYSGRANVWSLYQTDDVSSTTVAIIKETATGKIMGIAVGKDIDIECNQTGRTCEYREIGQGTELDLDRTTNAGVEHKGKIGGDTMLLNLGVDAKGTHKDFAGKIQGNFTTSVMDNRALFGGDKYRFRFNNLYGEYNQEKYRIRGGRQNVVGGLLLDGISADYFLGPDHAKDQKLVGIFAGLSPDPIDKMPSKDFLTFGPRVQWIPKFSEEGDTKLFVEAAMITEFFKGDMDRLYLYSKVHFTPVRQFSAMLYSKFELPWKGDDGEFNSSLLSFQTFWRPSTKWFFSAGFTQFRIDRHLQEQAIRWVTDDGSRQATRVGETLDRSQRYRVDVRTAFKPIPEVEPFLRGRYERRTFDSNKQDLNSDGTTTAAKNLGLLNQKNAYQGTAGLRLFLVDQLETETSGTYGQRYQSRFYSFYQSALWESGQLWSVDGYFQYVSSRRVVSKSSPTAAGLRENATDWYTGGGFSYRFLSDFLAQIRYDFGNEDDAVLDRSITSHTILGRLDYTF